MNEKPDIRLDTAWEFNNRAENECVTLKRLCQRIEKLFDLPAVRIRRYFAYVGDGWDGFERLEATTVERTSRFPRPDAYLLV